MTVSFPPTQLPTRRLGKSELEVSTIGLGCNNFGRRLDLEGTAAVLEAALAAGVTFFDTADVYGGGGASEALMGEVLEGRREEYVIATKFGMELDGVEDAPAVPRGSREYIRWAVEGSLKRLRIDRIDLYQYHQPDGQTPIGETLAALAELIGEGVVTAIGCSNFTAFELGGGRHAHRGARAAALRDPAERIQPARARDRGRSGAHVRAARHLDPSLLPPRQRPADRQVPAGRGGAGGGAAGGPGAGDRCAVRGDRRATALRQAPRARADRRRDRRPGGAARGRLGDRRGDEARAGAGNVGAAKWQPSEEELRELDRIAPTPRR